MSKIKFNMIINKCRLAKEGLEQVLFCAQDIHYPLKKDINDIMIEIDKIISKCRALRQDYEDVED